MHRPDVLIGDTKGFKVVDRADIRNSNRGIVDPSIYSWDQRWPGNERVTLAGSEYFKVLEMEVYLVE